MGPPDYLPLVPKYDTRTRIIFLGEGSGVTNLSRFAAPLLSEQFFHYAPSPKEISYTSLF